MLFYEINSIHGILDTFEYLMKVWLNIPQKSGRFLFTLEIKKFWKIKKNAPARTIKFSKKGDKLMIF